MKHLTDEDLINELRSRFEENLKLMKELKQLNIKLQESERLKSQFLSNIRNEINNPFAAILGLSKNILSMQQDDFEKSRKAASMIFNEAFKLDYQLKNIFAAAEVEAGELSPEIHEVNLHRLVQEVSQKFRHKAEEKSIQLQLSFELKDEVHGNPSFLFFSDSGMLKLILSNLLSNAIKFSPSESLVCITTSLHENGVSIEVQDQGIGINYANKKIIFDRFAQLDQGPSKMFTGHGLGLSISKALAELLNGSLSVESKEHVGSKFSLYLPEEKQFLEDENFSINEDGIFL